MKHDYPIQIAWSPEDGAYLAMALQLDGCIADGQTPEEALSNLHEVIQTWIEVAKEDGREVPEPMNVIDMARAQHEAAKQFQKDVQSALQSAVQQAAAEVQRHLSTEERPLPFFEGRFNPTELEPR